MGSNKLFNAQNPNPNYPSSYPPITFSQNPNPNLQIPNNFANLHHQRSNPYPLPPQNPNLPNPNSAFTPLQNPNFPNSTPQNPNSAYPTPQNPNSAFTALQNPNLPNSTPQNPNSAYPTPQNPNLPNPSSQNPNSAYPTLQNPNFYPSAPLQNPNPNVGGKTLMALLTPNVSPMLRVSSTKTGKGRHITNRNSIYDIDRRMEGEIQPQLEVTPITKYVSDPVLILGRQIAVNKTYICYGLKMGAIRVLNINTALRSLLKGLAHRVTDMVFFAEDVHLLASASIDGRIYVWKLTEGLDEDDKPQITGKIVISIQIVGERESVHPRVCWHCHKQEVLVVGIGRSVLRIDTTKVGKAKGNSSEEPLRVAIDSLIDGVQLVGKHEGEVTDLSMCQWMTTRLVSASTDGTIKIWEDRKAQPLLVLRPHDGHPVNSVTFLTAPHRPDHIILITGGPQNREMKIWVSGSEEGWLLPSDAESWRCTQTLNFNSSASRVEESFFNQVAALPQAGLLLLANAKKNAIYAVHLDYGANPTATRMDYVAEFTVTMPILSFTGTSDLLPHGEHLVQVYCVQTQAIQQYALDLSQCLPPPLENALLEKSDSVILREAIDSEGFANLEQPGSKPVDVSLTRSAPKQSIHDTDSESVIMSRRPPSSTSLDAVISAESSTLSLESKPIAPSAITSNNDISCVVSSPISLSPRLSGKLSGFRSPTNGSDTASVVDDRGGDKQVIEFSNSRQTDKCIPDIHLAEEDQRSNEKQVVRDDTSTVLDQPAKFKHPTHLVTPSEILMATTSDTSSVIEQTSEGEPKAQDVSVYSVEQSAEVDVQVVGQTGFYQSKDIGSQGELTKLALENKEKVFCSQASDLGMEITRECSALSPVEGTRPLDGSNENKIPTQPSNAEEEFHDTMEDVSEKSEGLNTSAAIPQQMTPTAQGKKQKDRNTAGPSQLPPSPSAFNSADLTSGSANVPPIEENLPHIMAIKDMLIQMEASRKEDQKQMMMAVAKETRRMEASMCRMVEKNSKANFDALWARVQEEFVKQERASRDRLQQTVSLVANSSNKEMPVILEKTIKKELAAVGQAVARTVTPVIEKTVSAAIADSFQRGVGDKAVNQLERSVTSKLEATVSRQIQSQFQTSGKQAIQEILKTSMEATVVPAFDRSCKAMFEQVDATFQKGMLEHSSASLQQLESTHSPLAASLRDVISSASSLKTLTAELADSQRQLVAMAVAGANSKAANPLITQLSNGPLGVFHDKIEAPFDPATELSRLISERKYEEAFTAALQRSDVSIVSWLCSQVDLHNILTAVPIPLSQGVLLSLLQQLACDFNNDTTRKLAWMTDVAVAINPSDAVIAGHVRRIFEQVNQILVHHRSRTSASGTEPPSLRILVHVVNSMLMGGK